MTHGARFLVEWRTDEFDLAGGRLPKAPQGDVNYIGAAPRNNKSSQRIIPTRKLAHHLAVRETSRQSEKRARD
jgi:hypothetical protein